MRKFYSIFFIALIFAITPSQAESPFKGGMQYTAVSKSPTETKGSLKKIDKKGAQKETLTEDKANSRVWNKYKALAAGQHDEESSEETEAQQAPEAAPAPPPKTGFAAIMDSYHKNKERQSKMRVIEIKKPEKPASPEVDKPDVK